MDYTPIATKNFGSSSEFPELNVVLHAWQQTDDVKAKTITVVYDIDLVSPSTGGIVKTLRTESYTRFGAKFDALRGSEIGTEISAMIQADVNKVQSPETAREDLLQTE